MKQSPILLLLFLLTLACQRKPASWEGPTLSRPRSQLTAGELLSGRQPPLLDMSFFARPEWADSAGTPFSGTLALPRTALTYPKEKAYYPEENYFPQLELHFLTHRGILLPAQAGRIHTSGSYWDVFIGYGKVWQEPTDGPWSRAAFPLTLTDRWMGQARNCVATFVYQKDTVSQVCLQCSQETADIDDQQLGNISAMLPAQFRPGPLPDSAQLVEQYQSWLGRQLPVRPLSEWDAEGEIAAYFNRSIYTNAPTSLGAVLADSQLYVHPPHTRHGPYPFPEDMRHGLYSVTKSMAGALALLHLEERYPDDLLNTPIADYVPALAEAPGWQGVTFSHTLNMLSGTAGGEGPEQLFLPLISAATAEEAIRNIALLGDAPPLPGAQFNYASTNLFVLSYALQQYVEEKEGPAARYWDIVHRDVLVPIGAGGFTTLHTQGDQARAIPRLAYGALPTLDEAAKIALLFANKGQHEGKQLLHRKSTEEALGGEWEGHPTGGDFRGSRYRHSFWSKTIPAGPCEVEAIYMLGFGENYVVFLPSGIILFRFMDEHDLNIDPLIQAVERRASSCR